MSYATIITGVPFEQVFKQVNIPVKKFNPDTGEPYMKDNFQWTICGRIIEKVDEDPSSYPTPYLPKGLEYASYNYEHESKRGMIIGVIVKQLVNDGGQAVEFYQDEISKAGRKAAQLFESMGFSGAIKAYLVLESTY